MRKWLIVLDDGTFQEVDAGQAFYLVENFPSSVMDSAKLTINLIKECIHCEFIEKEFPGEVINHYHLTEILAETGMERVADY